MSITISGGITLASGGWTITAAPPAAATAGWFSGGIQLPSYSSVTTVNRITFATDTATSSVRGPINYIRKYHSATGNFTYGYHGGGQYPGSTPGGYGTTVDRITYSTDTATASLRGPLDASRYQATATGTSNYGYFIAGYTDTGTIQDSTCRIDYSSDTSTASSRGTLSTGAFLLASTTDSTTYGWVGGGRNFPAISIVQRITYATDTATASLRGPLSYARYGLSASGNSSYGWFISGNGFSGIDRVTYANDTATATARGPLSGGSYYNGAAASNNDYGWFGGGRPGPVSTVQRIDYANDTATASARGPLSAVTYTFAASSGVQ